VPVLPAWPYQVSATAVPAYFNSAAAKQIPRNSVLLTYPYPAYPYVQPMYWQALNDFDFKLVGGYIRTGDPNGNFLNNGTPSNTGAVLADCEQGVGLLPSSSDSVTTDLRNWDVSTVVVTTNAPDPQCAIQLFTEVLGRSPRQAAGVWAWYGVQSDLSGT
jgi:hypothetical protein